MHCKEAQILLHGYLDNVLASSEAAAFSEHLAACNDCRRVYDQQGMLRAALRKQAAGQVPAPEALRARVLTTLRADASARQVSPFPWHWLPLGAALTGTAILVWGLTYFLLAPSQDERFADEAIAGHLRSLLIDHLTDMNAPEPTTVQAWFTGKLDLAPPIKDLSTQGFTLVGGRLDYLYDRKVAAVIYRQGQTAINLFIWPAEAAKDTPLRPLSEDGFSILLWTDRGLNFCSISTLDEQALIAFAKAYGARAS